MSAVGKHKSGWIFGSGATSHMCQDVHIFKDMMGCSNFEILTANNSTIKGQFTGSVRLPVEVNKTKDIVNFEDVLYLPELQVNLLSISRIVS